MNYTRTFALPALLFAAALVLASCGGAEQSSTESEDSMQGVDHGNMDRGSDGTASEMLMENGEYSDERFIDAMAPHHQAAVEMAQVAQRSAERPPPSRTRYKSYARSRRSSSVIRRSQRRCHLERWR